MSGYEDNIKLHVNQKGFVSVDCTHLALGLKELKALEDIVIKIWVLREVEIILINLKIIILSSLTSFVV